MSRIGRGSVQFLLTVMHKIMYIFVWYLSHGFIFKFMRCRYIFESMYIHVGTFQFACIICETFAAYYSSSFLFYVIWIHFSLY